MTFSVKNGIIYRGCDNVKFRYYFFKEGTRVYDKAELLTYLEAQPFMKLNQEGAIKVAKYHNTIINMDAEFIFNTKSIVPNIHKLDPKYLDLNVYVEFDVLNNTYKVSKIIDIIEVICKRFGFCVYNEYFEDVSLYKRSMLLNAFELVKVGYKKKYEEEFMNYSRLDKDSLTSIYSFLEIKEHIQNIDGYTFLDYVFLKENESRRVYVACDLDLKNPFIIPPCVKLIRLHLDDEVMIISYEELKHKISKFLNLVDARLYDVLMCDEKYFKKVKKIITKAKFDEVKVELKEVPFAQVLDL